MEREAQREHTLQELESLKKQPEEHPEHKMQLIQKLLCMQREDQQRQQRLNEVKREYNKIDAQKKATGTQTND